MIIVLWSPVSFEFFLKSSNKQKKSGSHNGRKWRSERFRDFIYCQTMLKLLRMAVVVKVCKSFLNCHFSYIYGISSYSQLLAIKKETNDKILFYFVLKKSTDLTGIKKKKNEETCNFQTHSSLLKCLYFYKNKKINPLKN